ncbi:hypothetical protein [Pontibacter rugosus]|uniref:Uncharacterized protein n=1 Tax=Pontibacter rugosus TaxID=1745966 RepID=A0ABW3SKV9_9BACT
MTYAELEALIGRIALDTLAGVGHFHCGGSDSLKQAVENHGYPVIDLDPITGTRNIETGNKVATITMGFFEKHENSPSASELQAIYSRQEAISARFLVMLDDEDDLGNIMVKDSLVPHHTAQNLAGIAIQFTLKLPISLCF